MKITILLFALALTIIPSILIASGLISEPLQKGLTLVGTALWFIAAPLFIKKESAEPNKSN